MPKTFDNPLILCDQEQDEQPAPVSLTIQNQKKQPQIGVKPPARLTQCSLRTRGEFKKLKIAQRRPTVTEQSVKSHSSLNSQQRDLNTPSNYQLSDQLPGPLRENAREETQRPSTHMDDSSLNEMQKAFFNPSPAQSDFVSPGGLKTAQQLYLDGAISQRQLIPLASNEVIQTEDPLIGSFLTATQQMEGPRKQRGSVSSLDDNNLQYTLSADESLMGSQAPRLPTYQ